MSENKDIQKVENDKDKIEYEKFHWEIQLSNDLIYALL